MVVAEGMSLISILLWLATIVLLTLSPLPSAGKLSPTLSLLPFQKMIEPLCFRVLSFAMVLISRRKLYALDTGHHLLKDRIVDSGLNLNQRRQARTWQK